MKPSLLDLLACSSCQNDLTLSVSARDGEEIMEGVLRCTSCSQTYPIRRGIPRFAEVIGAVEAATADAFGYEWTRYSELAQRYKHRNIAPDTLVTIAQRWEDVMVIVAGGPGKHSMFVPTFGATRSVTRAVLSADGGPWRPGMANEDRA